MKRPLVFNEKLGRQRVWGCANKRTGLVLVDPRQSPRRYLTTLVHEVLHVVAPEWGETRVARAGRRLAQAVWEAGFRKVKL